MGGERETILKKDVSDAVDAGGGISLGDIRCHEKNGYIHFHDDNSRLKAEVPSGIWFRLHEQLTSETPNKIRYADPTNQTLLTVKSRIKKAKKKKPAALAISVEVTPLVVEPTAAALKKFTEG